MEGNHFINMNETQHDILNNANHSGNDIQNVILLWFHADRHVGVLKKFLKANSH